MHSVVKAEDAKFQKPENDYVNQSKGKQEYNELQEYHLEDEDVQIIDREAVRQ